MSRKPPQYGPCTSCAESRHQPGQLAALEQLLLAHAYQVEQQPIAAPNRLEVWRDSHRVFVLCDTRRLARGGMREKPEGFPETFLSFLVWLLRVVRFGGVRV